MTKTSEAVSSSINLIGAGTSIEGEVKSNGDIRIDGTVNGSVTSKAKVVIGTTGIIEGDINCQNADISGTVKGKTNVSEMLFLKSTARITGDIISSKLVVESGASFTGSCNMGPVIKDIKSVDNKTVNNTVKEKTA
ncbi:MAG: polymer-forming cytoskeletal protein [Bacteroidota bacterium]